MQGLTNFRGKSVTLATSGTQYDIKSIVPTLFTGIVDQVDRADGAYAIEIKSVQDFQIQNSLSEYAVSY